MTSFKTATISDAQKITLLVNSAYRGEGAKKGWTTEAHILDGQRTDAEDIEEMIEDPSARIELALDPTNPSEIQGCVYLKQENATTLYFGMLTVNPLLQAKGLGKKLLAHMETVAHQLGCSQIRMTVIESRSELIDYYERRGFYSTGLKEPFPHDPRFGIPTVEKIEFLEFLKDLKIDS